MELTMNQRMNLMMVKILNKAEATSPMMNKPANGRADEQISR